MIGDKFPVVISIVSAPDWAWEAIATGSWDPGTGWLKTEGEVIPPVVLDAFVQLAPDGPGDHIDTQWGDFRYRMAFRRPN